MAQMEIEESASSGVDPQREAEGLEVLSRGTRPYKKLSRAGIDRLFVAPVDRHELAVLISEKLRDSSTPNRDFMMLVGYYLDLRKWRLYAPRKRAAPTKPKTGPEDKASAELHELVTELEKKQRGDAN